MSNNQRQSKTKRPYKLVFIDGVRVVFFADCPIREFLRGKFKRAYLKSRSEKGFGSAPVYECWFENIYGFNCLMAESKSIAHIDAIIKNSNEISRIKQQAVIGVKLTDRVLDDTYDLATVKLMKDGKPTKWEDLTVEDQLSTIKHGSEMGADRIRVQMRDGSIKTINIPKM